MTPDQLKKETLQNLQKLIGGQIISIFVESGKISKAENIILDGLGLISIAIKKGSSNYKWRLKFHNRNGKNFYTEFYEWQQTLLFKERFNYKTGKLNYDKDLGEDHKKYHLEIELSPKEAKDFELTRKIKSIKIYHYEGEFDFGENVDYLAIIDIETELGRRIIIEEDDPENSFYIHFDDLNNLNHRLAEIHDDKGKTFGKKRYQLRHEIY